MSGGNKVRLLPDAVASQVAAGEVVERPASVLKELVENSLDAGATKIEAEFSRGGTGLVLVRDDGSGMERDDALLCLERHATSKIRTGEDLERITTYGFRGEAVPSIASVSRFRLATRPHGADAGTEILVDGGKISAVRDCGDAPGTTVEARQLFYNMPARKKFLRSELTESGHLLHAFQTFALAHPGVAFALRKDGRLVHHLAPTDDLRVRVRDLFGPEWEENLLSPPDADFAGIRVSGLVARPGFLRGDRSGVFFFLNRRPVHDAAILRGIRAAIPHSDGCGNRPPPCILFLEMDPSRFDCNVHPAKREVRFGRPDQVSAAVEAFVRGAQRRPSAHPSSHSPANFATASARHPIEPPNTHAPPFPSPEPPPEEPPQTRPEPLEPAPLRWKPAPEELPLQAPAHPAGPELARPAPAAPATARREDPTPDFAFRGQLGSRYYLWQSEEGLVLMEIRNAVERIFYEEAAKLGGAAGRTHPAQQLLPPVTLTLSPRDAAWVAENSAALADFGLIVEPFGVSAVKIEALPAGMDGWSAEEILLSLADETRGGGRSSAKRFLRDQIALSIARLRAMRASPSADDAPGLLRRLFACEMPYTSPSGKPTLLQMSWRELERKFL